MLSAILLFARAAVVLGFALVVIRLLRRSSASLRYLVLATALTGVLVLPAIELMLPTWHAGALPAEVAMPPPIEVALPVAEAGGPAGAPAPIIARPADLTIPWTTIVGGVWLAVFGLALLRVGIGAARARAIAWRGTRVDGADNKVADAWRSLGGRGEPPRVVASSEVEAPIVVGAIAPVVVVPRAATGWSGERWRVVLLHELAHVHQRDGLVNLIAQLACCLHWIDLLAWIAARRLRDERELAADDAVLRAGARASLYAEHLFEIATAAPHAPASVLAMATPSRFESRMVALLDAERPRRAGVRRAVAVVAAVTLVTVGVACVSPDQAPLPADVVEPKAAPTGDRALQSFAERELERATAEHHATGAIAIVLDAKTGAPLAIASRGDADPRAARTPGSTIKPFTLAAALEAGTVDPTSRLDCENGARAYGSRVLRDATPNGTLDLGGILAVSSNVCMAKVAEPLGDVLGESFRRYRIAAPSRIDTRSLEGASIASGEGLQVSALDVATAYTAFAGAGVHHAPDGSAIRVMREDAARSVLEMMERVVNDPRGTGQAARIAGVRVAGKTGTAKVQGTETYYSSFVGIVPADAPRVVILVGFNGVTAPGGKVAAPVFATLASRALAR